MRRFRKLIEVSIPVIGTVIVFVAVILISDVNLQTRVLTVLIGVLFIEAGVWKLTSPLLPSERRYVELREEVVRFTFLVRSLNQADLEACEAGTNESWRQVRRVMEAMHSSVDQMAELAGKVVAGEPTRVPSSGDA